MLNSWKVLARYKMEKQSQWGKMLGSMAVGAGAGVGIPYLISSIKDLQSRAAKGDIYSALEAQKLADLINAGKNADLVKTLGGLGLGAGGLYMLYDLMRDKRKEEEKK